MTTKPKNLYELFNRLITMANKSIKVSRKALKTIKSEKWRAVISDHITTYNRLIRICKTGLDGIDKEELHKDKSETVKEIRAIKQKIKAVKAEIAYNEQCLEILETRTD